MKEEALFGPVREFFLAQDFLVEGEVRGCDLVATQGERLVIVELKLQFQLKLVYQAMHRQKLSDEVYIALPRPPGGLRQKTWRDRIGLCRRLGIGMILVSLDSPLPQAEVLLAPVAQPARRNRKELSRLHKELGGRTYSQNTGGVFRQIILTAHREQSLALACALENGEVSCRVLRKAGFSDKGIRILQQNVYGWFLRIERGVYALADAGRAALEEPLHERLVEQYRAQWKSGMKEEK